MKLADIPLDEIQTDSLLRDRTRIDPAALDDLVRSITEIGLRQPVEVFGIVQGPNHTRPYGLISGYRRLMAYRAMGQATIPALLCNPVDIPAAMAAMVAENEIRAQITPWEKGRLIVTLVDKQHFPSEDQAIRTLYPTATRQQRSRLSGFQLVFAALANSDIRTPEDLGSLQMDRLATAIRLGGALAITETLAANAAPFQRLPAQWEALRPVLDAIMSESGSTAASPPRRPRHALALPQGITLTRIRAHNGWIIRLTGPMAKSPGLVDDIFELVEKMLGERE